MTAPALISRVVLATVFLAAAAGKLGRRREFGKTVRGYELVSDRVAHVIATALPPLELASGLSLAAGLATRAVAVAVAALLLAFAGAVAINLLRGREIDCGCLGATGARRITWATVARNIILVAAAALVAANRPTPLSLDHLLLGGHLAMTAGDAVALVLATVAAFAAVALISTAVALQRAIGALPSSEGAA